MRVLAALAALALLPGCMSLVQGPGERQRTLAGETDGYVPTGPFLKVEVREEGGKRVLVLFDRVDWHVARIVDDLERKAVQRLHVETTAREIPGEYLVDKVLDPSQLEAYRYSAMSVSDEERLLLDAEYEAVLERWAQQHAPEAVPQRPAPDPALPVG